jgi:hypothetical protein
MNFGCPFQIHLARGMQWAAHSADGNPSNAGQVKISNTLQQRFN